MIALTSQGQKKARQISNSDPKSTILTLLNENGAMELFELVDVLNTTPQRAKLLVQSLESSNLVVVND